MTRFILTTLGIVLCAYLGYVIGKFIGHAEAGAATMARWKAQSEAVSPASAPAKGWGGP